MTLTFSITICLYSILLIYSEMPKVDHRIQSIKYQKIQTKVRRQLTNQGF